MYIWNWIISNWIRSKSHSQGIVIGRRRHVANLFSVFVTGCTGEWMCVYMMANLKASLPFDICINREKPTHTHTHTYIQYEILSGQCQDNDAVLRFLCAWMISFVKLITPCVFVCLCVCVSVQINWHLYDIFKMPWLSFLALTFPALNHPQRPFKALGL